VKPSFDMPPAMLVSLIEGQMGNVAIVTAAIKALAMQAKSRKDELMNAGAYRAIVAAFRIHESYEVVCQGACVALVNLSIRNGAHRDTIIAAGVLGPLVAALRMHEASKSTCMCALTAFVILFSSGNAALREAMIAAGALGPIVSAFRIHRPSRMICSCACEILRSLCKGNTSRKKAIIAAGAVSLLAQASCDHGINTARSALFSLGFSAEGTRM